MATAIPLNEFMELNELLLNTHREDAIFTVVCNHPQNGLLMAVPSAWMGIRWSGVGRVSDAFSHPAYLTGAEAHTAILAEPNLPTVLLYRSIEGLALYGSLTK